MRARRRKETHSNEKKEEREVLSDHRHRTCMDGPVKKRETVYFSGIYLIGLLVKRRRKRVDEYLLCVPMWVSRSSP